MLLPIPEPPLGGALGGISLANPKMMSPIAYVRTPINRVTFLPFFSSKVLTTPPKMV